MIFPIPAFRDPRTARECESSRRSADHDCFDVSGLYGQYQYVVSLWVGGNACATQRYPVYGGEVENRLAVGLENPTSTRDSLGSMGSISSPMSLRPVE